MFLSIIVAGLLTAGTPDTLQTVTLVADRGVIVSKSDTVAIADAPDITDVLEQIPGLYVNDYGGRSGLTSVSLRGLGSAHTSLYLDGVKVCNVQSGQADLGMLDIENMESVTVDYAQNSLSFRSIRPSFNKRPIAGTVRFRGGSFGTYEPSARLDFRISDRINLSASAAGTICEGDFRYGDGLTRKNNDIKQVRGGIDLRGTLIDGGWHAKLYYNGGERGTPGSADWPSTDRQKDRNAIVQGLFRKQFTDIYNLNLSAKTSYDDVSYQSTYGDSRYKQTEVQINSSHRFSVNRWLNLSLAADLQWDGLKSTLYDASRFGTVITGAGAIKTDLFKANLAVEYNGTTDKDVGGRHFLSPSLELRVKGFKGFEIIAFCRRAYRNPTFNELYYPNYGNPDLKPETAWLSNLGAEWYRRLSERWKLAAKADFFYNHLKDKITSAPTAEDPNIWLPYNIGIVQSLGVDLQMEAYFSAGDWKAGAKARYSYQNATDRTPETDTYGQPIAYVDRNVVTTNLEGSYKGWEVEVRWNLHSGRRDSYGEMPDWNTLDLKLRKEFTFGKDLRTGLSLLINNITDNRYESVSGYPMPGRSLMGGIEFKF